MKKTTKLFIILLAFAALFALTACEKKDNNPTPANAEENNQAERKITRIKSYPDKPAQGTEMNDSWHVTSFFEEYTFSENGKLAEHTKDCIIDDAGNFEAVNAALAAAGQNVAWGEGNTSFVISFTNETKSPEEVINYFNDLNCGYIIFYSDDSSEAVDKK